MSTHQIHVFISHSWKYTADYETLRAWIFDQRWNVGQASLDLRNYSVPKDDPIHNARNEQELRKAIYLQIAMSHVVVIPTGMYTAYSKWIQKEIDGAKMYGKPILAVNPHGQERKASVVVANASDTAGWRSETVVGKIWSLSRGV
jgi:hypothetical protein